MRAPLTPPPEKSPEELEEKAFNDGFQRTRRVEAGLPILNRIPYFQRLFSNTAYSRNYIWDGLFGMGDAAAVVSPDGKYLLTGAGNGGAVSIFNLLDPADHQIAFVPSRNDGRLRNIEMTDGGMSYDFDPSMPDGSTVAWLRFTPDASAFLVYRIYCAATPAQPDVPEVETMELFDRATGQLLGTIPIEPKFRAGAVSPDGRFLLAAGASSLEYWDLTNGQKVGSVPLYGIGELNDIRCTPDGRFVFLVPVAGNVRVYDFRSMTEVASLPAGNVRPVIDISPDGRVLLVVSTVTNDVTFPRGDFSQSIQRYEIGTWRPLPVPDITVRNEKDSAFAVLNVRFSRDGNRLVAFGEFRREMPGRITEIGRGLYEFDLHSPGGDWRTVRADTLPLHPDGKFLLDGRHGTSPNPGFVERMTGTTMRVR